MSNGKIKEWLNLWHRLLDDPSIQPFNEPRDLAGVLADFRRDPERLAKAFESLPHGEALLSRVKRCIGTERQHEGVYLVPDPVETSDDELRQLAVEALERGSRCCGIEVPNYPIHVVRRPMTSAESLKAALLVEELDDLYMTFPHDPGSPESEAMQFLSEILYTLASSFEVKGYCLTPLFSDDIRRIDPYEPQIELWSHGAHAVVRWANESDDPWVDIFVSSKTTRATVDGESNGNS